MTIGELPPAEAVKIMYGIEEEIRPNILCRWFGCSIRIEKTLKNWHYLYLYRCARCGKIHDYRRSFID